MLDLGIIDPTRSLIMKYALLLASSLLILSGFGTSAKAEQSAAINSLSLEPTSPASSFSPSAPDRLKPRVETGLKAGTERSILTTGAWVPLAQSRDAVFYGDLRFMGDDHDNREGNFGLGYRQIVSSWDSVVGGHAWIDQRRTARGATLHQVTVGAEVLGQTWDFRLNSYISLSGKEEHISGADSDPYLAGTGIFYDRAGRIIEEPQSGFDAEIGYRLPVFEQNVDAIRLYGGGYAFYGDITDNVIGGRVRATIDINSVVSVGARFQHDDIRGSQGFAEATIRFPFKAKKTFQQDGLRARLDESAERDIDIVSGEKIADKGGTAAVLNSATGTAQRVIHVNNTSIAGDGSAENPYATLAAAETASAAYDVIYVHAGDGTTTGMDQGIVLNKTGQMLVGSGTDFIFDNGNFITSRGDNLSGTIIAEASTAPVITNSQISIDEYTGNGVLVTAENVTVAGITVDGASRNGVAVLADGTTMSASNIQNIISRDNVRNGIYFHAYNGGVIDTVAAEKNFLENNALEGLVAQVSGTNSGMNDVSILNNRATGNRISGIYMYALNGGEIETLTLNDNISENTLASGGTNGRGYNIRAEGTDSLISDVFLNGNTSQNNNADGYIIYAVSNGAITNFTADDNIATGSLAPSTGSGFQAVLTTGTITNFTMRNNNSFLNRQRGLYVTMNTGATIGNLTLDTNHFVDNQQQGLLLIVRANNVISDLYISNNTISENTLEGMTINGTSNGTITASAIGNNIVTGNLSTGIYINDDSSGSLGINLGDGTLGSGNNSIYGNAGADLRLDLDGSPTPLPAQYNWWGNANGPQAGQITNENGVPAPCPNGGNTACGFADTSNYLTSAP